MAKKIISRFDRNKGFTLTEMAIVLGIMGSMLGAIWQASSMVSNNYKISQGTKDLLSLINSTKMTYRNAALPPGGDWTGDVAPTLLAGGAIPSDMVAPGGGIVNQWGGNVGIGILDASTIRVLYSNVTVQACIEMASQGLMTHQIVGFFTYSNDFSINGGWMTDVAPTFAAIQDTCTMNLAGSKTMVVSFDFNVG